MRYYVGTYTVKAKEYCHRRFYQRFREIVADNPACIVDGTVGNGYRRLLSVTAAQIPHCKYIHITHDSGPNFFHRSVEAGANELRKECLLSGADCLLIIESDVIPPPNVLALLQSTINTLEIQGHTDWGILGGLYYRGWHNYELRGLQQVLHVLSGCTVYKRALLEKCPFRFDLNNLTAFPDAFMSHDAHNNGFSAWNDHEIRCDHIK